MTLTPAEPATARGVPRPDTAADAPAATGPAQPAGPRGLRKAALFLAQLSSEEAGQVLARLRPREVERITAELLRLGSVAADEADQVLAEVHASVRGGQLYGSGGEEFAREILTAGLGGAKAEELLARIQAAYTEAPFASLRTADTRQLLTFLKDEHPQIIALVLAHLAPAQSAEVLSGLPADQQAHIAHRIAVTDRTTPEMARLVEDELTRRMGSLLRDDATEVGGVVALVEIINRSGRPTERSILDWLDIHDSELADQVRAQMFVFEDILIIDDRSLQQVLREIDTVDLATALKGVRTDVRDKIFRNLSERAADNLTEEIDLLGPVRTHLVEEAQTRIVAAIRGLEASGELTLSRGDDDLIT